jgi:hypothetical protein
MQSPATVRAPATVQSPVVRWGSRPARKPVGTAVSPAAAVRTAARGSRSLAGRSPGSAVPEAMVRTRGSEAVARSRELGVVAGTRGLGLPTTARPLAVSRPASGTRGPDENPAGGRSPRLEGMAVAGATVPTGAWPTSGPRWVAGSLQTEGPARARNPVAGRSQGQRTDQPIWPRDSWDVVQNCVDRKESAEDRIAPSRSDAEKRRTKAWVRGADGCSWERLWWAS